MELITAFTIHNIFSKQQIQTIVHYSDESYNGDSNMNCTINDLNLSFDKDNRLRTTIGRVAGWSVDKAYVLASFLQDESFKKYLSKMLTDKDIIGGAAIDLKNITDNDYININQNKLGSLLNVYYIDHYHSVNNSKTNKALGRLNGFSSGTAKTVGLNYTADRIIDKYYDEFGKAKPKKSQEIIAEVINDIEHELYKQVNLFANDVISSDKYSKAARDYAQKFINIIKRIEENNNKIKETTIFANANKNQLRQYNGKKVTEEEKAIIKRLTDTDKQYKEELAALGKDNARAALDRYVIAQNLVNLYANNVDGALNKRLRNFANLVAQMKGDTNGWFFQVMNTKRMTSIVKEFNNIGDIEEYIEQQDENNDDIIDKYNGQDVDQTTKSWEDSLYKSFNSAISGKMRIILSRVPKLSSPFNPTAETQSLDTENELGVKTYMDAQFITVQMFSFGDFSDIESMVRSIEHRANTVEELYGIGMLVNQMKQDKVFANYMYANFAKPLVNKTMCVISDLTKESGITFNYSNANAFYSTKMAFDMMNKLRASYNTQYDINDYKTIQALGNKLRNPKLPIEFDDTEIIYNILLKYFPNIKREVYDNFLRGIKDDKRNALINFTQNLIAIINGAGALKTKINTAIEESNKKYNNDKKKFNQEYNAYVEAGDTQAIKQMKYPTYQGIDYTEYDLDPNTLKAVIRLAENLSDYSASKARLNTANAEGNTASDVTKNCYITRFFEQINAGTEEDSNAGLHALLDYITQGTENGKENQYSNNPLFFGVKDENGRVIIPGMFTRVGDIFDINKNAKEILNYSLFDGTKNAQSGNGSGYASMSKLDFFVTQYIAYANSVGDINENGINKKIGNLDSSVYAMRIGSDAPKIYMIRAPRYNYRQLQYAFYNHLMDELNMYVNGLNKIFRKNNAGEYKIVTSTNGLYGRAFFDERAADNLRKDGKKDMSKAFVEENNGRLQLAGKMFKFLRLFDVNGHSAATDIETALSLYGGVDANATSLFIKDGRTKLKLNKDYINSENGFIKELTDEQGTRLVLDLGATQKKALLNIVDNWMKDVLQESTARTSDFVQAMKHNNIQYTQPMIQSFILNALNMNMNYDDMFEGDFKFYNNARDFLKRTKESQAGGDGYSGYRLTELPRRGITENTYFSEPEIINVKTAKNTEAGNYIVPTYDNGSIVNKPMTARNGFRAVTIHNTIKPSDVAMDLQETLEEEFISQGMSKEDAHARSVKIAGGYFAQTKVNDAQSFITLEEFIRRKYADGTIGDYQDLIAQLLDPNVKAEDIDIDAVNARIQVQKNFYFDKQFDPYTGTFVPRQIKNAEFVLIPKLLPQDSDLIKVYEWMRANDIGQLNTAETDKAAKKNIFTIWSEDTGEFIDPRNNKKFREDYIQNYYYQYLYKQQDVPQHMINEENKLGAQIQKKIIDNVSTASKQVQDWANEYQEALVENIREDYIRFLDRMGWEYDSESGHIVNSEYATKDANGNPLPAEIIKSNRETLNLTDFYTRAREEAARLGMDSNFIEYLIPNEFGVTTMPNLMNNVAAKLESVAQALFNRTVTRQTMPGWHAAQVTDVGYSRRLRFDAKTGVMQVYLPRWSNLLPKPKNAEEEKKFLEQIAKEGLDIHFGYRIPTEGKQSISVLRVVGFTNDALGSTIIVPEEWVTQTGSDFDVDSIYGICYEIYAKKDKKGNITVHKIPCEEDKVDNDNLYINYVNSRLEDKVKRSDIGEEIESRIKELRDSLKAQIGDKLNSNNAAFVTVDTQRNELFNKLPAWARGIIVNEQAKAKRVAKKDKVSVDLRGEYQAINKLFDEQLTKRNLDDATADIIKQYMDYQTSLINIMNEQDGITTFDKEEYISSKKDIIANAVEKARKEQVKLCEEKATELGLMSYDDFAKQPLVKRLSRKARNNYILDRMINIMNDRSSREEQYGRSQFEGIAGEKTSANDIINKISGQSKRSYSPYNPLDQLDYFEDAMGGARLKALSVNWDTFVSKCNRTHPILSKEDAVEFVLPEEHIEDNAIDYDIKTIKKAYPDAIKERELTYEENNNTNSENSSVSKNRQSSVRKQTIFTANKIGWSDTNKNLVGDFVTTYTAQTTAHHLDAVKQGSIPNVNEYTFHVYKFLTTIGLDHETSVGFIRQPAITKLVANNNLINSVFFSSKNDAVKMTLADIATRLGRKAKGKYDITHNTSLGVILNSLKEDGWFVEEFKYQTGIDITKINNNKILKLRIPLNKADIFKHIKNEATKTGDMYENAVQDVIALIQFSQYKRTTDKLNEYIQALNADKIGAAPSIRETRQMRDRINKLRQDSTLTIDGESMINKIYPADKYNPNAIKVDESVYAPIAAVYSMATLPSIEVGGKIFTMENEDFALAEETVQQTIHKRLNTEEYKEYKRYAVATLYNTISKLLTPLTVDERGRIISYSEEILDENTELKTASPYWDRERSRIVGYGITDEGNFKCANINAPTADEIKEYLKLTPAQKVMFIQRNFSDNQGVFNNIKVTLINNTDVRNKGISRQYLNYDDQVDSIEDLFSMFENSFSNHNPLIKLAAIDLIKYAFIAEGFNFKSGYITKIVPNDTLYTDVENGGMDIIDDIKTKGEALYHIIQSEEFINNFMRSHSGLAPLFTLTPKDKTTNIFISCSNIDGLVSFDMTTENTQATWLHSQLMLQRYVDGYIRVTHPVGENKTPITTLYKVLGRNEITDENGFVKGYKDIYLVPLNLLDKYESYDVSYNQNYNQFNDYSYYVDRVDNLANETESYRSYNINKFEEYNEKMLATDKNDTNIRAQYSKMSEQYLRESQRARSKAIDKYPGKSNPIGKFNSTTNKTFDNPNALMELAESSDKYLAGAVSKFINDINKAFISKLASGDNIGMFVVNNSYQLNNLIPAGTFIIQDFTNEDGDIVRLQIGHAYTKNLLKTIYNITHGKNDNNVNLKYAIKQLAETNTRPNAANYFYITQVPITNKEAEERLNAATDLIADDSVVEDAGLPRRGTTRVNIDVVSASVMKQIQYEALKNNDAIARRFIQTMERRGINKNYRSSLAEHRKDIYRAAARYYQSAANSLINALNGYEIAGQTLRMDSPKFFEELAKHDEEFNKVAKIILDAVTFGNRIASIMQLDIAAEDKETKEGIQSIQNSINSIRTNTGFKTALANMFNIYFKKYSTNPDISDGLLNLRDQFGDIDTIVALISDPAEINNNEVQVILKNIYSMFSKAEMFDTERNIKEWKEQLAKIDAMTESLDMDKIIDSEHGMLRQDYNDKYLEDKQKVIDDFNEARKHKDESQEAFTKYIKAKYARDEFMYKHQHQLIVDDYYKEDLAMRKEVMDKAKDLYYEYMRYITELYNLNTGEDEDNEDVKKRKTELINHITAMRADNDITGELKPIQQRMKVKALNDYITKHRELAHKYFNTQEYDGFQEDYNRYNDYIKYYDKTHKRLSLEEKLDDPEYREAYNWIKNNGKLRYTDEAAVKIANAFDVLTKRQTAISNNTLRAIRKMEGVIDDNGIIDGRKLTNEQISQLREEEMDELATKYENGNGEMMLIKMISVRPPIMNSRPKDDESKKILMDLQYKDNKLKFKIIQHINEILMKAVDADTGEVNMAYLFNNNYVTNEDREELAELYTQLRSLRSETLRKFKKRKNKVYEDVIDNNAYNKAKIFYDTLPKGSIQAKQWLNIFTELDADGNLVPNSNLFGYRQPKEDFVDHERTNARDFIFDNIEFVPNEYYWLAAEEHKEKGDYDEWFKQNNVYNPYTHKYEPLKIWTTMQAKPDSELAKSIEYVPTFDNMERSVKEEYINPNFKEFSPNYKKGNSKYDTNIKLNLKEQALKDLIQQTLNKYATTYQGRKFVGRGFLPRSRSVQINPRWAGGQLMSLFGVSWHSGADSDSFHDIVDYSHDREAEMKMLSLLKGKGTKEYIPSPKRMEYKTAEEYEKAVEEVRKQNHEIYLQNLAIDNKNLNRNWRKVMEDFVYNATIFNSRQAAKPYLYLLLEDLKNNDAYKIKGMWNKRLLKDVDTSTKDDPQYQRQAQTRTQQLIHNLARRLLFDQYHENSVARSVANLLQNITSAKYMVFNLYGGIANITTGKVNIRAEEFANEYFGFRELKSAEKEYLTNICAFLASRFTDKSPTLAAAFIKQFHVVDFDQVLQFAANEGELNTKVREFRDFLYSFQSMGEHYMQNTVLFAMLKSNRLYTDTNGVMRIGDFKDFTWDVEKTAMRNILAEYPEVATDYEMYIKGIREYDIETKLDISTGRKNLNRNFLYSIRDNTNQYSQDLYKEIATKYHAEVKNLMKEAKQQFMTNPTVESLYEFVDGRAELKKEYKDKVPTDNKIGDLETLIGQFKEKVKSVNKKIHGVYDKDGAAQIESKWWGSLVAQYHKHLPTGIWKRWRRKGYYSEFRGSRERGSYQTFIDFMGTEFINYKKRIKQQSTDTNIALASIQVTFQSIINTLTNLQFNWNNLAPWEKANMRRNLGDLSGVLIACLVVAALYGLSDDDDIKDDKFKASLLYLADRLYSDSTMYSPVGLVSEYKTAWSSPIASANGPSDLMKAMTIIPQYLFDPDYDKKYTTGLYKGQDKLMVLLRRNLPGIRPWDRVQMIARNNNYYKIDSSQIGIGIAKDFGELLAGE